jgi:hypothetical protein
MSVHRELMKKITFLLQCMHSSCMLSAHCGTDSESAAQGPRPRAPTIYFKDLRLLGRLHSFGEPWLEHDERYRRSEEFIQILKGFWTQERFTFKGDFYRINEG